MEGNEDEKIYDAPKKTHKSNVWRYFGFFKRDGELDKTHVICKQCRVAIKYAGNTTNLATHMKRRHGVDTSAAPPSSPSGSTGAPDTPSGSRAGDKNSRSTTVAPEHPLPPSPWQPLGRSRGHSLQLHA